MQSIDTDYKKDLIREVEGLPPEKIKEVLDFIYFIKANYIIDPSQMYFWTTKWQEMEKEADKDKEASNIVGDWTAEDLLKNLTRDRIMMHELDNVVLSHDIDEYGLKEGDVGAVVHCYENGTAFEVEFVTSGGETTALLTLTQKDIRQCRAGRFCMFENTNS